MGGGRLARRARIAESSADDLLEQALAGDQHAFSRLLVLYEATLQSAARQICIDPVEREDCLQEAFQAIWRGLPTFRGESSVATWMATVTRNAAIAHMRRKHRSAIPTEIHPNTRPIGSPSSDTSEHSDDIRLVARALQGLPDDHRCALIRSAIDGDSHEVIARDLLQAPGTIGAWISRDRASLRRLMSQGASDD